MACRRNGAERSPGSPAPESDLAAVQRLTSDCRERSVGAVARLGPKREAIGVEVCVRVPAVASNGAAARLKPASAPIRLPLGLLPWNEARRLAATVRAAQVTGLACPRCKTSHCAWRPGDWPGDAARAVPGLGCGVPGSIASQPLHEAASGSTGFSSSKDTLAVIGFVLEPPLAKSPPKMADTCQGPNIQRINARGARCKWT